MLQYVTIKVCHPLVNWGGHPRVVCRVFDKYRTSLLGRLTASSSTTHFYISKARSSYYELHVHRWLSNHKKLSVIYRSIHVPSTPSNLVEICGSLSWFPTFPSALQSAFPAALPNLTEGRRSSDQPGRSSWRRNGCRISLLVALRRDPVSGFMPHRIPIKNEIPLPQHTPTHRIPYPLETARSVAAMAGHMAPKAALQAAPNVAD